MNEGVIEQEAAVPVHQVTQDTVSDKEMNFRKLEQAKEEARDRATKAELEAALLRQRLDMLEQRNQPKEVDPLDGVEDYVDPKTLKAALDLRDKRNKKEAEDIADRRFNEWKQKDAQQNHVQRLKSEYTDFDQVLNENNVVKLEETNPEFVQSLLHIKDDYERKKLAYNFIKRNNVTKTEAPKQSIKERVEENAKNPYYMPSGSGSPTSAIDFDIKSPQARHAAYAKLKAAQRGVIGGSQTR